MSIKRIVSASLLEREFVFTTSRSSGPGGQNVNKVNTKVTLKFDIPNSALLTIEEKEILLNKLTASLTKDGVWLLTSQDKRSQLQNKEAVIQKLDNALTKAFTKKKVRKATKPSTGSVQKRITEKKNRSEKKQWRQKFSD
ncbi:MAG: aminoacyl-tRNA hydrolase [Cyclobacteriaceae bacterium]|nr:aminoacyl-tRNA hydrolase [Cyclobacteriaceae bacterium]